MQGLRFINGKYAWYPLKSHWKEEKQMKFFFTSKSFTFCTSCVSSQIKTINSFVKNLVDKWASELRNCNIKCHSEYYNARLNNKKYLFVIKIRHKRENILNLNIAHHTSGY